MKNGKRKNDESLLKFKKIPILDMIRIQIIEEENDQNLKGKIWKEIPMKEIKNAHG